jgi:hypothetical protein
VNINGRFTGFMFDARAKAAKRRTYRQKQIKGCPISGIALLGMFVTRGTTPIAPTNGFLSPRNSASRPTNLGLSSIVEFSQADLQKTEADIEGSDAAYPISQTQIVLAFTMAGLK